MPDRLVVFIIDATTSPPGWRARHQRERRPCVTPSRSQRSCLQATPSHRLWHGLRMLQSTLQPPPYHQPDDQMTRRASHICCGGRWWSMLNVSYDSLNIVHIYSSKPLWIYTTSVPKYKMFGLFSFLSDSDVSRRFLVCWYTHHGPYVVQITISKHLIIWQSSAFLHKMGVQIKNPFWLLGVPIVEKSISKCY